MKKVVISIFSVLVFFSSGISVYGETGADFSKDELSALEKEVNQVVNEEIQTVIQSQVDQSASVEIGEISIELSESTVSFYDYDKEKVLAAFREEVASLSEAYLYTTFEIEEKKSSAGENNIQNIGTYSVIDRGSYYTARVWAGFPALGHGYINQDFSAVRSSFRFTSFRLLGQSYKSGVMLGTWIHNRSWVTLVSTGRVAEVRMRGVLDYVYKGSPISYPTTFLKVVGMYDL